MNINATIVMQALNVFISFWFVKKLLIKPVMAAIHADQAVINDLQHSIDENRMRMEVQERTHAHLWNKARSVFIERTPSELKRSITPDAQNQDVPYTVSFSSDDQKEFIDQSVKKIVARLESSVK